MKTTEDRVTEILHSLAILRQKYGDKIGKTNNPDDWSYDEFPRLTQSFFEIPYLIDTYTLWQRDELIHELWVLLRFGRYRQDTNPKWENPTVSYYKHLLFCRYQKIIEYLNDLNNIYLGNPLNPGLTRAEKAKILTDAIFNEALISLEKGISKRRIASFLSKRFYITPRHIRRLLDTRNFYDMHFTELKIVHCRKIEYRTRKIKKNIIINNALLLKRT